MVECDIRPAKDGVLVLAHDETVTNRDGNRYTITETDSEVLARLDLGAGEGVPTLQALVNWAQGRCAIMADMKCEGNGVEEQVAHILQPLSVEYKIVPGADTESRARFRAVDSSLPLSLSVPASYESHIPTEDLGAKVVAMDVQAVTWEYPLLTLERIQQLQEAGLRVFAWTVDDPVIQQRLLAWGLDGIISNRPDLF